MAQEEGIVVGVDVSKAILDVAILPSGESLQVANDVKGWGELLKRLRALAVTVVGFEASGGYERGLLKALHKAGVGAARVNPARVRDFARACGVLAKNDRIDALMIARFLQSLPPRLTDPSPRTEALAELVCARRQITQDLVRTSNQAAHATSALIRRTFGRRKRGLEADLKIIEQEIARLIAEDSVLARKAELVRSAPGVGPATCATLLALLPELGTVSNRAAASLVGVAPFDRDSGQMRGQRRIWGGRRPVRDALYMAALGSLNAKHSIFKAAYERLRANHKPPKVALVAVMRKLLVTLNAMLRDDKPWQTT